MTVTILITNLLDGAMGAVITPAYVQHFFYSPIPQGILMGVFGGMAFLGTLIYGAIGHRLPRRTTLGASFTIVSMRIIGMALLPALPFLIFIHALTGLACGPLNPLLSAMSYERVPKELRARVFGTSTAGVLVGIPAGVMLCGYLVTWIGLIPSVFTMGAIYLLTTLSLLINPALKGMEKAPQEQSKSPSQASPAT
ncbi:MFS transporter [Ktedonobacter racemifer]|uniref:MFS transporter n=1 Tax=Ktedonobacter racemifer TaxID=363277 RepID=UPI00030F47E4|nr:MFS transporter [Ktedonobacter racemifer]